MQNLNAIFVITDLTHASDHALRAGAALARARGARLCVANALPDQLRFEEYLRLMFTPQRFARAQDAALRQQVKRVLGDHNDVHTILNIDPTAEVLTQQAHEFGADLIIVSRAASAELATALAAGARLPVLLVGAELTLPIGRAVLPISSPVPNQQAIAAAKLWTQVLGTARDEQTEVVELELLQMAYISADSGAAGAAVRELRTHESNPQVKLAWRASPAELPARQGRRLTERHDVDVVITPLHMRREHSASAKLSPLNRTLLRTCPQAVLILPLVRERVAALA